MSQRRTLIGLAIAFVLLAFALAVQNQQRLDAPLPTAPVRFSRVLPELTVLEIQAIQLENPNLEGQQFIMARGGDGLWVGVDPARAIQAEAVTPLPAGETILPDGQPTPTLSLGGARPLLEDMGTNIARTIVLLPYTRVLPLPEDADMQLYGFSPNGLLFIQVVRADGTGHVIAVGTLTPDRSSYYVLVDDQPNVYVVERPAVDYLVTQLRTPPYATS